MARLFISCVSNEFGNYRDALRKDFTRPNVEVKIQEDFIAGGSSTMEKLDDYIRQCDAVIHLCGDMTGAIANNISVDYINNTYPGFASRLPQLQEVLYGNEHLSYTQWEAYLAIQHGKKLFTASPVAGALRDDRFVADDNQAQLQQQHLQRLRSHGYYDEIHFANEDELAKKLYQSKLGEIIFGTPARKPANLPYQSIGNAFKGRKIFMEELHAAFNEKSGVTGIVVYGLGGMGKTRVAVEYALRYKNDYTALLFVNASTPALLETNIGNLSDPKVLDLPKFTLQDEEKKYAAVINWLNQYTGWLLILDNVDTDEAAEKAEEVFAQLQNGHILITSRVERWSMQVKKKHLDVLHEEDAVSFLLETTDEERQKKENDLANAKLIADDVGYLALALEHTRAYIATKEISFETYRKTWKTTQPKVMEWFDEREMQYHSRMAITWQTSFDQLSAEATILLNRLCWLAPDPIPKTLLQVEVPGAEPIDGATAWEELKRYSLATSAADKKAFTIHKLVQDVTRNNAKKNMVLQPLYDALVWLTLAFTGDPANVNNWPALEPLIPHILSLIEFAQINGITHLIGGLMNDISILFLSKAQYKTAEPLMRRALEIDEKRFGSNHPNVAIVLSNLSQLLQDTNRSQEAEPLMKRALAINEQSFGENHPNVATDLNNLAALLKTSNRLKEAEPLMKRTLAIDEQNFGPNHPKIARDLNNLAQLLQDTNCLQEAEPLMKRALAIDEQSFGENHPDVARDLNNLAALLQDTNRLQEAEPLMKRALAIDEQSFGENHPDVARDLNNLAVLLQATNRLQEAEPLMKRALAIDEQIFGENHPNVAIALYNLADLLRASDRLQEAEPLMKRALEIDEQSFGSNHPNVARDLNKFAQLLRAANRMQEAEPLMMRALEIDEQSFGENHPNVGKDLMNLALLLLAANRMQEAEPLMKRALEIDEQNFGSNHPRVGGDLINLARLLKATNREKEAEPLIERSFAIFHASFGKDNPSTQTVHDK